MSTPTVKLNDGVVMPQIGFGVFQVPAAETTAAVSAALEVGYRSIDTAAAYRNEAAVGAALADSGIAREDLFVTTKLWNADQGRDATLRAFDASLEKLGLDHLDLYLIHWPAPGLDRYVETWQALTELQASGRVRSVGVSNFQPAHLQRLAENSDVVPSINQIELHPYLRQDEVRAYDAEHGIITEAWSPLAKGGTLLDDPAVTEVATRVGATPAQVVLAWHLQRGTVVIPKSVTPARIAENLAATSVELAATDLALLDGLDRGERTGPDPDAFNAA